MISNRPIKYSNFRECWGRICLLVVCLSAGACAVPRWDQPDQTFVSDNELSAAALDRQGLNFAAQSRLVDAELKFRQALYLYPQAETISFNLAVVLDQAGLTEEAISIYNELLARYPEAIQYRVGLGHAYLSSQNFDLAVKHYSLALSLSEKLNNKKAQSDIARSLSVIYFSAGQEEQALCYSRLAQALDDSSPEEMVRHMRLMIGTGHGVSEQQNFRDFIEAHKLEKDPRVDTLQALLAFALGNFKESKDRTDEAYDLATNLPDLRKDLIVLTKVLARLVPKPTPSPDSSSQLLPNTGGENSTDSTSDSTSGEDEIAIDADLVSGGISLYWPANLVAEAANLIETDVKPDA